MSTRWLALALACSLWAGAARAQVGDGGPALIAGDDPAVRYPVAHEHGMGGPCLGYLYFSRKTIKYEVVSPASSKGHSFELQRSDLANAQQWKQGLGLFGINLVESPLSAVEFRFSSAGVYHFWHVPQSMVDSGRFQRGQQLGYQDLLTAANDFDAALSIAQAREARLHPAPPPPAPPPSINILEPVGLEVGKLMEVGPTLRVHGIAAHSSGIASVTVNGRVAGMKPLTPQTVEFEVPDLAVASGVGALIVFVTATDHTVAQQTYTISRPEVKIAEPAPGFETSDATVVVRGTATGFRDLQLVSIAGQTAQLERRATGEVGFTSPPVNLALGDNVLAGLAISAGGNQQTFQVTVKRKPPPGPPPLTLPEVEDALRRMPHGRVKALVEQYGVDFALTDEAESRLRAAGASDALLLMIAKAKK